MVSVKYVNEKRQLIHATGTYMDMVVLALEKQIIDQSNSIRILLYLSDKEAEKNPEADNKYDNEYENEVKIELEQLEIKEDILDMIKRAMANDNSSKLKKEIIRG
ncbi:MAG: hypothetical protein FGO69_09685 [Methanobacterium sp.]|nr:MAG: hypothetical protein FGO69_09685 [Methanobacterium sp.]